ncbi:MAG: hypothetical protein ACXWZY_08495 [Gaiellaceae bacterium]
MATMADLDQLALAMPQATKEVSDDGRPTRAAVKSVTAALPSFTPAPTRGTHGDRRRRVENPEP